MSLTRLQVNEGKCILLCFDLVFEKGDLMDVYVYDLDKLYLDTLLFFNILLQFNAANKDEKIHISLQHIHIVLCAYSTCLELRLLLFHPSVMLSLIHFSQTIACFDILASILHHYYHHQYQKNFSFPVMFYFLASQPTHAHTHAHTHIMNLKNILHMRYIFLSLMYFD